jgi:2-polyprenyl-3-methyl-5-hydroxy-6-metoxy-1,4-benzoquinol methylase
MHLSSLENMREFRQKHLAGKEGSPLRILDLGSMAIGGSNRTIFEEDQWEYIGIDIASGQNVDMVLSDPYNWLEIESCSMDVVISGQAFEHIEYFWKTMTEVGRVLKHGGICCIIAPSGGPEHRYPVDCWRFYPDGFSALARYAGLEVVSVSTQREPQGYEDDSDQWADTVLIARKPEKKEYEEEASEHLYRRDIHHESEDSLGKIIRHIEPNKSILELGPATGYLTQYLKEKLGCSVHCIEISETMASEAEKYCEKMVVADINAVNLEEVFAGNTYDYVIIADVLEHLAQDERTLASCCKLLKPGGLCIVSVPNIAHAGITGGLLKGRFDYRNEGLLDRTHVNFYTRKSITRLLKKCGFSIVTMDSVEKLPEDTEFGDSLTDLPFNTQKEILDREDALAYQFIFVCEASHDSKESKYDDYDRPVHSAVDLRRLHLQGVNERMDELEKAYSHAQELAFERQETLRKYEKELPYAQALAHERMDTIDQLTDQKKQLADRKKQLSDQNKHLADRNKHLADRKKHLADQNKHLADRNKQLAEQKQLLAEQKGQLTEQNITLLDERRQLKDQVITLMNHPGYKAYEKAKRILIKMKIFRVKT